MNRYGFAVIVVLLGLMAGQAAAAPAHTSPAPQKQILICVSDQASPAVRKAAQDLARNPATVPVLKALIETQGAGPAVLESSELVLKQYDLAAYNHLVIIGLLESDPLLARVWEHYVSQPAPDQSFYAQGWGYLQGDMGYVESDRNPFLHSRRNKAAPFETVLMKISGTSEAGVAAALHAYQGGLLNGIVPAGPIGRPKKTVLDLDPFADPCPLELPKALQIAGAGNATGGGLLAGWSQVPANEYRAYAEIGCAEPLHVWRYKYLVPHALDEAGVAGWLAGLNRMAWGSAVTISEFSTPGEAAKTAQAIGAAGGFRSLPGEAKIHASVALQPAAPMKPGDPNDDEILPNPPGTIVCAAVGKYVVLSSLDSKIAIPLLHTLGEHSGSN